MLRTKSELGRNQERLFIYKFMPNSNDALISWIIKSVIVLLTNSINVMGGLSCPTDFFIANKLIVLGSSLSSTGSRNMKTLSIRYRVEVSILLFSIFPVKHLPIVPKKVTEIFSQCQIIVAGLAIYFYIVGRICIKEFLVKKWIDGFPHFMTIIFAFVKSFTTYIFF